MNSDASLRFGGVSRLLGKNSLAKLAESHVAVVGIGGVGSWTCEALARSGIGRITLIDMDDVCISNVNRQLPALNSTLGQFKVQVMADRLTAINPHCEVKPVCEFLTTKNADTLLLDSIDCVIDATDRMSVKACILDTARRKEIRAVTVGGSGGRKDPSKIQTADLGRSGGDELLRQVRRKLRREYGWEKGENALYDIPTIFSTEPQIFCWKDGSLRDEPEEKSETRLNCSSGLGSICSITGIFGFLAATAAIEEVLR